MLRLLGKAWGLHGLRDISSILASPQALRRSSSLSKIRESIRRGSEKLVSRLRGEGAAGAAGMKRAMSLNILNVDGPRAPGTQVRGPWGQKWSGATWVGTEIRQKQGGRAGVRFSRWWVGVRRDPGQEQRWVLLGVEVRWVDDWLPGWTQHLPLTSPPTIPCACLQFPSWHLDKAPRTLSASTQDLSPR